MTSSRDLQLNELMRALARITGCRVPDAVLTLSQLSIDSRHLVQLMIACDDIYGTAVHFEMLDITVETSIATLHRKILDSLGVGPLRG
jgi:hypothetical protein